MRQPLNYSFQNDLAKVSGREVADHLDRDGLNNRNNNLQLKPRRSNNHNRIDSVPEFIGVHTVDPLRHHTFLRLQGTIYHLPSLTDPKQCAFLYDALCMGFDGVVPPHGTVLTPREQQQLLSTLLKALTTRKRHRISQVLTTGLIPYLHTRDLGVIKRYVEYAEKLASKQSLGQIIRVPALIHLQRSPLLVASVHSMPIYAHPMCSCTSGRAPFMQRNHANFSPGLRQRRLPCTG